MEFITQLINKIKPSSSKLDLTKLYPEEVELYHLILDFLNNPQSEYKTHYSSQSLRATLNLVHIKNENGRIYNLEIESSYPSIGRYQSSTLRTYMNWQDTGIREFPLGTRFCQKQLPILNINCYQNRMSDEFQKMVWTLAKIGVQNSKSYPRMNY